MSGFKTAANKLKIATAQEDEDVDYSWYSPRSIGNAFRGYASGATEKRLVEKLHQNFVVISELYNKIDITSAKYDSFTQDQKKEYEQNLTDFVKKMQATILSLNQLSPNNKFKNEFITLFETYRELDSDTPANKQLKLNSTMFTFANGGRRRHRSRRHRTRRSRGARRTHRRRR